MLGYKLGQSVAFAQRQLLDARYVLNSHLGSHCAVSDDVRNFFLAVFLRYITQYVRTSVVIEVDIDIRQRNTVRIEKTFEQQVILYRVYLGDTQAVCHT